MKECIVETSLTYSIVHNSDEASEKIFDDETNFELTMEQATALIDANNGHYGPIWCGHCYPERTPNF